MKSLRSISFLALVMAGCVTIKPSHLTRDTSPVTRHASRVTKYAPPLTSDLYKATLDIKKHHLTGLLVIKRMDTITPFTVPPPDSGTAPPTVNGDSSAVYRIVFMNEVGMTFFDLEMKTGSFKVVSCFASLNKKALMKIFETDFRMLNWTDLLKNEKICRQAVTNHMVVSGTTGPYQAWQTYSASADTLFTTAAKSTIADPVIISFSKYSNGTPGNITIDNPFIGMKLSLRKLVK
jgi:hypothetical protein